MQPNQIAAMISAQIQGAKVEVIDTTGTFDHFKVEVISGQFAGLSRLAQHRLVQSAVQEAINDGRIHALSIVTKEN